MDLNEYQAVTGATWAHLARQCGCGRQMIAKIARGDVRPSFELAIKIEEATFGQVLRDNWYPRSEKPQ